MSSSFIQIKPIGSHQMGMLSWNNPLTLSSQDFSQARRRVSCNLFGVRPEKGAINETYRQEEQKRIEQFKQRYICFDSDSEEPSKQQQQPSSLAAATTPTTRPPTTTKTTTTNIAESRLSSSGGESLIEKELREHEMKLKQQQQQQRKKTANCNEKLVVAVAGDRIKSRSLKLEELTAAGAAAAAPRTLFVDSSKCASSHGERPKPYARQQSSITDYYPQRKTVVCNNSRTAAPEIQSAEEVTEVLPHLLDEADQFDSTTATSSAVSNNESSASSSSSTTTPHQCEQEPSQEQKVSLHTMTTDVSVELA